MGRSGLSSTDSVTYPTLRWHAVFAGPTLQRRADMILGIRLPTPHSPNWSPATRGPSELVAKPVTNGERGTLDAAKEARKVVTAYPFR